MPVAVREIPVTIYLNNEYIGYGSVCYVDESAVQLVDTVRYRCVKQWLCIDNYCYNDVVELCYEDKVSSFLGGLDVKTLKVNVYDAEGNAVGDAVLNLYDSYSLSIVWVLLNLAFLWAQIVALLAVVAFIRKEK
jgi:hypothetical protein